MKTPARVLALSLLLLAAPAFARGPRDDLAGVRVGMSPEEVREHLSKLGAPKPGQKRGRGEEDQETWVLRRGAFGFVVVGYGEDRVEWVSAFVRQGGKPMHFTDVGPRASARHPGNWQWLWELPARHERAAVRVIARGRDSVNVASISLLRAGSAEAEDRDRERHEDGEGHEH